MIVTMRKLVQVGLMTPVQSGLDVGARRVVDLDVF